MGHVTIPNRPNPKENRDINAILTNFDAITNVINGNLDSTNIAENSLTEANISPGTFVSLAIKGKKERLAFSGTNTTKFVGASNAVLLSVGHLLAKVPSAVLLTAGTIKTAGGNTAVIACLNTVEHPPGYDATNIYIVLFTINGLKVLSETETVSVDWVAIG